MHAAQPMHSYCRPLRMSMPVGQTCTQMLQSMQSPGRATRGSRLARARAARLAARRVVADDQRVLVEHRALEARVGAHVLADLLAHEAGVAVGGEAVEQDPERSPTGPSAKRAATSAPSVADRREVADEGEAGPQRRARSRPRACRLAAASLSRDHGARVELHARAAVAFDLALDPQEDLGVDGLRAGVAAPQAPGDRGEQEQRQRRR